MSGYLLLIGVVVFGLIVLICTRKIMKIFRMNYLLGYKKGEKNETSN